MKKGSVREKLIYLAGAAIVLAASFLFSFTGLLYNLDKLIADPLYQTVSRTDENIHIIAIDEQTIAEYGEPSTWSRSVLAALIGILNKNEADAPAVIAIDMILTTDKDEEGDRLLADACALRDNVVSAVNLVYRDSVTLDEDSLSVDDGNVEAVEYPYDALLQVSSAGFANTVQDTDGYIRSARLCQQLNSGENICSLAYMTYRKYCSREGIEERTIATYGNNLFEFQFSGNPSDSTVHSYEIVSMKNVLDGYVDPKVYAGSIVLIGAFAPGMGDAYNVAVRHGQQMYGVEIQANIIEALKEGRTAVRMKSLYYALIVMIFALLYYVISGRCGAAISAVIGIGMIAIDLAAGRLLYQNGIVIQIIDLPICVLLIYAFQLVRKYLFELFRKKQVLSVFKKYVAPQIVDEISRKSEFEIDLGGENRNIACLFVDIRGFTTMSEGLRPDEVVGILNEYLALITDAIFRNSGTLDKFIGDAAMAVFNAPFDLNDYVYRAVCTARDIAAGSGELEKNS